MNLIQHLEQQISIALVDKEFIEACKNLHINLSIEIFTGSGSENKKLTILDNDKDKTEIVISAKDEFWQKISKEFPDPGYQSFTAIKRLHGDEINISADETLLACALHAIERLFEIFRNQVDYKQDHYYKHAIDLSTINGNYANIKLPDDQDTTIYFDQSGDKSRPTLLMLHTAGADSAQYHALMANTELQKDWHMVAFDMPAHGRSMPLRDDLWQGYHLTKQTYIDICTSFVNTVIKKPVVALGCSMGAAMVLKLAQAVPDIISSVVALEAPFKATGRISNNLANPHINQTTHNPSYVRGLMSPKSPLYLRRTAAWIYSRAGFQVYLGDLEFYSNDFDAEKDLKGLNAQNKIISLLTGSYDYSATPADSKKVADLIPGSRFRIMENLGHFPMVENPDELLKYLKPELDLIKGIVS